MTTDAMNGVSTGTGWCVSPGADKMGRGGGGGRLPTEMEKSELMLRFYPWLFCT